MGAWDYGPFDNDGALDFVGGLADEPGDVTEKLRAAMVSVIESRDYLDLDDVSAALAAACLVAGRLDPAVMTNVNGKHYLEQLTFDAGPLREPASSAFVRSFAGGDNEWFELWADADAMAEVEAAHAPYRQVLAS
ncbi:DUF4259 domain-containing protein [Actinomadura hibisca]|uniref:DUF4259 domain-containing protein n=1 Tax=Actinomadura hibisca TaxID=68565 RepID=UPI00082A2459|nr:DUF4259 domain-containing protein [Actinomadura hibisca]